MTHKIIQTENYLLVVSDEEIEKKDWFLYFYEGKKYVCRRDNTDVGNYEEDNGELLEGIGKEYYSEATFTYIVYLKDCKKIIAHKPLNGAPYLEGVDELPEFEDEVFKLFNEVDSNIDFSEFCFTSFKLAYNKTKETYTYTLSDLRRAFTKGRDLKTEERDGFDEWKIFTKFIDSLNKPKLPIAFVCETTPMNLDEIREQGKGFLNTNTNKLKTITNSEGRTEWVGTYKF